MPTYRNDGAGSIAGIVNTNNARVTVAPGGIVTTYKYYPEITDLTKTAETPYYPFCLAQAAPNIVAAGDMDAITIDPDTDIIEITNMSAVVLTLYFQAKANPNVVVIPPATQRRIEHIQGRFTQLIIAAAGAVPAGALYVHQFIK